MKELFTRSRFNPILKPKPVHWWEAKKLYNPAAIFHHGKYHLFYRAMGSGTNWKSSLGYAVSGEGENFQRFNQPLMLGEGENEKRGIEDPRITKIGDTFFMVYAAYDGTTPRLSIATSSDLKTWSKRGTALSDWHFEKAGGVCIRFDENGKAFRKPEPSQWSKSGAIFPEKINGKYWMLFGEYQMWFASSLDGIKWTAEQKPFLEARQGDYFDNTFVEMGPPPIKTKNGWLVLYHGVNNNHWYRIGFLLLDLENPHRIIFRTEKPIFEPSEKYEMSGIVDVLPGGLEMMQNMTEKELESFLAEVKAKGIMPKVTFCCGATVVNNVLRIYYGASDSVICTATADLKNILVLTR